MNQIKVTYVPIISIKGINPSSIIEGILKGHFNIKPSFLNGTTTSTPLAPLVTAVVSNDNQDSKCSYDYMDGSPRLNVVTTGVDTFNGSICSGVCFYCKRHYDELPFGVCVRIVDNGYNGKKEYFIQDRRMCSPECCLGRVYDTNLSDRDRDLYDKLTREMLSAYTDISTPFRVPSRYELLEEHGGTESYEVWSSSYKKYTLVKDVIITPIKREYIVTSS